MLEKLKKAFEDDPPPQLAPLPQARAHFPQYIAQHCTSIILKERILHGLSGDDFEVKDIEGNLLMTVTGQYATMSERKNVFDAGGKHLFDIRRDNHLSGKCDYYLEDGAGNKFVSIDHLHFYSTRKHYIRYKDAATGEEVELYQEAAHITSDADITLDKVPVAKIQRKSWNMEEFGWNAQTYTVTVAPGMDMAIIIASAICLDELRNDGREQSATY